MKLGRIEALRRPPSFASGALTICGAALVLAIILAAINPVGFVGGGFDDFQYLSAARCLAEHGFCTPRTHWATRLPFLYPAALGVRILGSSREALWVVPFLFFSAATGLLGLCVAKIYDRSAALFAMAAFVLCPDVGNRVLDFTVDVPELAFVIGAVFCLLQRRPVLAGLCFGLAIMCRPTTLALAPIFAAFLWDDRKQLLSLVAATAVALAAEAVAYLIWCGDPLLPWRLSLHHTDIPSVRLHGFARGRIPLFNMDLVASWGATANIPAPWQVRAPVNYLLSPMLVLLHILAAIGLVIARDRRLYGLAIACVVYFAALAYGFAIDPNSRMFLPILAAEAAIAGAGIMHLHGERRIQAMLVALPLIIAVGGANAFNRFDYRTGVEVGARWLSEDRSLVAYPALAERMTLNYQQPQVYRSGHGRVVVDDEGTCAHAAAALPLPDSWRIERETLIPRLEPLVVHWMRTHYLFIAPRNPNVACIFDA